MKFPTPDEFNIILEKRKKRKRLDTERCLEDIHAALMSGSLKVITVTGYDGQIIKDTMAQFGWKVERDYAGGLLTLTPLDSETAE